MRILPSTIWNLLALPGERTRFIRYWFLVFSFLVVLPNLGFIIEILFNQPFLNLSERLAEVLSLYTNTFRFLFEPITFSIILLSVVLALNFQIIRFIRRHNQAARGRLRSTMTMLVGGHCVACGGSLLAPLVSLFTGSGAYFSSERYFKIQALTLALNLIAILIALVSMARATGAVETILQSKRLSSART